ncbi:MAG: HAMP domain-containing histidine kinase, partial [Clostridia bacterium]|nr:HAMP domain-containing histidine kinase [Clostridia bacterium]
KQTKTMTDMTHRLVYLSRAEEQENHFVKIDFPISDLVEETADSYRAVAQSSGKTFSAEIEKGISYRGDEKAIRELMTALIDNAFKYSTENGDIKVVFNSNGSNVKFTVENSVSEISEEQLARFGQRFYRAESSSKVKGFGIGLSVVRAVAQAHKGKLIAELPEKNRIRFTVLLK